MQGKSLAGGRAVSDGGSGTSAEGERIIRERLSGLGYLG
jgi:hypothetical protein